MDGLDKSLDECTDLFCFAKLLLILNFGCFHDNESLPLFLFFFMGESLPLLICCTMMNYLGEEN